MKSANIFLAFAVAEFQHGTEDWKDKWTQSIDENRNEVLLINSGPSCRNSLDLNSVYLKLFEVNIVANFMVFSRKQLANFSFFYLKRHNRLY